MVYNNSFLVVEVRPANNEKSVPINTTVTVRFIEAMKQGTVEAGITLNKVNGVAIPATVVYEPTTKTATLTPNALLEKSTQYRIIVEGTASGVQTVTNGYLPGNKIYEFTTTEDMIVSPPKSLEVHNNGGRITWVQPDQFDPLLPLTYEVYISTSSLDPVADPGGIVWPQVDDAVGPVDGLAVNTTAALADGNYYAYVRAKNSSSTSAWTQVQFLITTSTSGGGGGGGPTSPSALFEVRATYPKADAINITPASIKILFTANLDYTTVTPDSVYIIKAAKPDSLSIIDLMMDFSPTNSINFTIDAMTTPNLISLTIPADTFENSSEYTVIVRETIKDTDGNALGETYFWSFFTVLTPFYGDPQRVREDLGMFLRNIPDTVLYKYMHDVSIIAYDIVSTQDGFNAATFEENVPHYVHEYVRFQTGYDLLVNAFLEKSSGLGSMRILGDLTIDTSRSQNSSAILSNFKDRIKYWLDLLHGHHNRGYAKPTVAVKGESVEPYPDFFSRTTLKDLEG